jgi:HAMP domain-containing protein
VLERESEREHPSEPSAGGETAEELGESGLLDARDGLADVAGEETGELRVLSAPIRRPGRRLGTFRVADPLRPVEDAESGLNRAVVLVGLLALVASVAIALAIATLMTRRLRAMARVASAVGEEDLKARIGGRHGRDEIGVPAHAFDSMLDRLERAFARQREFVSDASHELHTPLTVLRGQVELLDNETDPTQRHRAIATVLRELGGMNRLVDEMLTLAASESTDLVRKQRIEVAGFVEDLRRDLLLLGERSYSVSGTSAGTLTADPDRLHQVAAQSCAQHGPGDSPRRPYRDHAHRQRRRTRVFGLGHRPGHPARGTGAHIRPLPSCRCCTRPRSRWDRSRARDRAGCRPRAWRVDPCGVPGEGGDHDPIRRAWLRGRLTASRGEVDVPIGCASASLSRWRSLIGWQSLIARSNGLSS